MPKIKEAVAKTAASGGGEAGDSQGTGMHAKGVQRFPEDHWGLRKHLKKGSHWSGQIPAVVS